MALCHSNVHVPRNLQPESRGFSEKNRAFLRQFADPHALPALLGLADDLVRRAERKGTKGRRIAVLVEMAVAIAIELVIPLRIDNLAGLRIDRHLHRHGETLLLSIPAAKTKNGSAIDAELPPRLVRVLDIYMRVYRPRLAGADSPWLFPGEAGGRRQTGGFGSQLSRFIHRETGIRMTPHQFRHLAAKLYLDVHPGDYETVRRLLGHKNVATTIRFYQELSKLMASQRYNEIVTELTAEHGFTLSPAGK
jgi:integrase